jgi:flagellar hook-associated protein 2
MPDIFVPGVKSRFETDKIVEGLMQVERLPKDRLVQANETLALQKSNWQNLGRRISQVRDDARLLFSYQNPFNDKTAASGNDQTLSAVATRSAGAENHEFVVKQVASADRFLSKPLDANFAVPAGNYQFSTGQNQVSFKFSGGSLQEFADTVNRRGQDKVKASVMSIQQGKKSLLIESRETGADNHLTFSDDALKLALQTGIVGEGAREPKITHIKAVASRADGASPVYESVSGDGMRVPPMSNINVSLLDGINPSPTTILRFETALNPVDSMLPPAGAAAPAPAVPPPPSEEGAALRTNAEIASGVYPPQPPIPLNAQTGGTMVDGKYVIQTQRTSADDGAQEPQTAQTVQESPQEAPQENPLAQNEPSQQESPPSQAAQSQPQSTQAARYDNLAILSLELSDGTKVALPPIKNSVDFSSNQYQLFPLAEGQTVSAISIDNDNTHRAVSIRNIQIFDPVSSGGAKPLNPVSSAADAIIMMDGIEIQRPGNLIDDLIPGVTLNAHTVSDRPVSLNVETDTEAVKDAVISFVGNYNRLMAELNVLTRSDEAVIRELSYLSPDEQDDLRKRLGAFSGDSDLTRFKGRLQQIMSAPYLDETGENRLLSSFGITTDARRSGNYDPSKMRGYLEIDEAVLDESLKTKIDEMQRLFGRDSDGDMIVDTGLAYELDRTVRPYVEMGGIIAIRSASIDSRIGTNDRQIETLDRQLSAKEQTLKTQYGQLEGAYTRMERMSNSLNNFSQQSNNNR